VPADVLAEDRRSFPRPAQNDRRTNATVIYEELFRSIARMELRPGDPLQEKTLSERFGVSRTPIREALLHLAQTGLVDLFPQVGTFVARIPIAAIREAIVVRRTLEEMVVAHVAQIADQKDVAELDVILAQQRLSVAREDIAAFHEADEAFHEALTKSAGFTTLWLMIRQMKVHLDRVRVLALPVEGRMDQTLMEHQRIRDAIARNDVESAKEALHVHLGVIAPYIEELSTRYPNYFIPSNARLPD
jgi:DNA-binding GntR family transcriptional regulator